MTWYPDLGPIDFFPVADSSSLRAVGWLDSDQPFDTGPTSKDDFERLCELLVDPWHPPWTYAGYHRCDLCAYTGGPSTILFRGHTIRIGLVNLFVPSGDVLYVAPSLILHTIDSHHYRPPEEFLAAVRACPPTRSMDYKRALLAAGGRSLLRATEP